MRVRGSGPPATGQMQCVIVFIAQLKGGVLPCWTVLQTRCRHFRDGRENPMDVRLFTDTTVLTPDGSKPQQERLAIEVPSLYMYGLTPS